MAHGCSKSVLALMNTLLMICGISLIILSFFIYQKYQSGQLILGIIILACFTVFLACLGLYGTLKSSKMVLTIYVLLISLITLIFVVLLFVFILQRDWLIERSIESYEKSILNQKFLTNEKNALAVRDFLMKLDCCGFQKRNEPKQIFDLIGFCQENNTEKILCNERMTNHLIGNFSSIIIVLGVVTGLGVLACLVAARLVCSR